MARKLENSWGIYEDPKGLNIWWIQYFDSERKRDREKAGRREAAINLLAMRRTVKLEGRKLPAPRQSVLFAPYVRTLWNTQERKTRPRASTN